MPTEQYFVLFEYFHRFEIFIENNDFLRFVNARFL